MQRHAAAAKNSGVYTVVNEPLFDEGKVGRCQRRDAPFSAFMTQ
jgi:hypothetical protein